MVPTGMARWALIGAIVLGVAVIGSACGGDDDGDGELSADSVASKITDQSVYEATGCTETADAEAEGGISFTCETTTVSGGGPGSPLPGQDATIVVTEVGGDLTATVTAGGQIIDFFTLE